MSATTKAKKICKTEKRVLTEEEYVYQCEWNECEDEIVDMSQFVKHISQHVKEYVSSTPLEKTEDNATCFSCHWKECGSQILGNLCDFNRHVYFHAFHVRLKCLGKFLCYSAGCVDGCTLDGQSRNWIPELPENLICGWKDCEVIYDNPVYFYSHVNLHCDEYQDGNNIEGGARCKWTGCDTLVKNKYKLKEHIRSHSQEKVVACPTCGGLFSNRTKFLDHQKRQAETAKQLYQCSHCNKRFATARILRDHMRHHVNHYKCPFCDMTCPAPSSLRSHIRYRHTQDKPYKCGHCLHSAKSGNDLRRHLESHNESGAFHCQERDCNFDARTYPALTAHHVKVHQNTKSVKAKYACHVCEKKLSRGSILTNHLKTKHKFKWPSGHSRFRYKLHDDGYWRLQTVRYESIEVSDQYLANNESSSSMSTESNKDEPVVMETETQEEVEADSKLDLLGKVALINRQSKEALETISVSDIHQSQDMDENVLIDQNSPAQSRSNKTEKRPITSSNHIVIHDLSSNSVCDPCLDMPIL